MDEDSNQGTQELAAELTIAWLSNPNTRAQATDVREFLLSMFEAVSSLVTEQAAAPDSQPAEEYKPATTVRRSLASPEHIISLIDGRSYKTLRRHLAGHGLSPDQYRQRYGLKPDYPMVAPAYAEVRRAMAKKIGLGRKPRTDAPASEALPPAAKPSKRGRKPATDTE